MRLVDKKQESKFKRIKSEVDDGRKDQWGHPKRRVDQSDDRPDKATFAADRVFTRTAREIRCLLFSIAGSVLFVYLCEFQSL